MCPEAQRRMIDAMKCRSASTALHMTAASTAAIEQAIHVLRAALGTAR